MLEEYVKLLLDPLPPALDALRNWGEDPVFNPDLDMSPSVAFVCIDRYTLHTGQVLCLRI